MSAGAELDMDLTVRLTEAPGAPLYEFRLVVRHGIAPQPADLKGSTLPDPAAALAAVERFGDEVFFAPRRADMMCTQQYGGPQVAVVTGTFHGRPVHSSFSLTDGCEIARWRSLAPLLGGTAGSTGET
ncbi:serine protease inhibitor [Arthrobacter sp. B10-11]|uniref:serine protease inhibitor n=1 Tax=Arthrobacter sp. B10-11 TaxID=3081160 RepID=UPI002952B6D7|nr:serine protease inhibitor [Arthrobacter sp. B10-11]MDV8147355.1 serine protease inhibitor [Arthrobacter sp. B10-11]